MPRLRPTLVPLLLLAAAAACRTPATGSPPSVSATSPGPLASSLQVQAAGADSVRLVFQVTNASQAPVRLTFSSGQTYDFAVSDAGRTLWTWSADKSFLQALRTETLAAGETRSFEEVWLPERDARGRLLTATARLVSTDYPVEVSSGFVVP